MQFQKKTKELLDLQESTMLSGACPIPIDSPKEVPLLICIHSATLKMPGTSTSQFPPPSLQVKLDLTVRLKPSWTGGPV